MILFHKKCNRAFFFSLFLLAGNIRAEEHKVHMQNWLFTPKDLTISVGDKVVWVNNDDTVHDIYFEDPLPGFPAKDDTHIVRIGKTFSLTFEKKGKYNYFCKRHLDYDMIGSITVK